jgi:hypothetical protein
LHDGVPNSFAFFLFILVLLELGVGVAFDPLEGLISDVINGFFVVIGELVLEFGIVELLFDGVAVVLEGVFGFDLLFNSVIFSFICFSLFNKLLDLLSVKSTFFIGNGNLLCLTSAFLSSINIHNSISINIESNLNLWSTSGSWWDTFKVEFTKQVVILCHFSFTFVDLDQNTGLVIGVGCEDLLFFGWDAGVSFDEDGHDSTCGFDTEGEWDNVEEEDVFAFCRFVSSDDSGLDSGTESDSLVWVDRSVGVSSVKEVLKKLDDLWDSS